MVAVRLSDVDDLNRRARYVLWDQCYLGNDEIVLAGRPFAVSDEVLALRNDYQLGLLNGTRATIDRIDTDRQEMTLATTTTTGEQLTIPFAYAEAGHLTHGYATTVHKAQGATVDRCFVLVDDTMSREHAYTALSRGRHGNELFVVAEDRRIEERHTPEVEFDPLDAVRSAFGRSAGKHMAVENLEPTATPLEQLQRERDEVRGRLGDGPSDPSWEYRRLTEALAWCQHGGQGAEWRLDTARKALHDLGPIGRRTHRAERRELKGRIAGFESDITRHDANIADLETQLAGLTPEMLVRSAWERKHMPTLERVDTLDRHIDLNQRLDRVAARELERGLERDLGIEL